MDETITPSSPYQPQDQMLDSIQDRAHDAASFNDTKEMENEEMTPKMKQARSVRAFVAHFKARGLESPRHYIVTGFWEEVVELWKEIMGDIEIPPWYQIAGQVRLTDWIDAMTPGSKQVRLVTAFVAYFKSMGLEPLRHYLNIDNQDKVVELWKDTMGDAEIPQWYQTKGEVLLADWNDTKDAGSEEMTRNARFMRAFAGNLKTEGLRSPHYYHDKSQCLSFHENASPAEMGYLKARSLKNGYIEPEELISQLRELKSSDNFTLRKYRHQWMQWDKSPIEEDPYVQQPPDADWFFDQMYVIGDMRRQLGNRLTESYQKEAQDHWDGVCDIDLTPLPDLYLLKDMGRSPSGTLFPRYLVKGLYDLRERANERGEKYYDKEYEKAKIKRRDAIHRWQEKNPDLILADDPLSVYRTWPSDLMDELDALDREAI